MDNLIKLLIAAQVFPALVLLLFFIMIFWVGAYKHKKTMQAIIFFLTVFFMIFWFTQVA